MLRVGHLRVKSLGFCCKGQISEISKVKDFRYRASGSLQCIGFRTPKGFYKII